MPMAMHCPNCEARLSLADRLAGRTIRCPHCAAIFLVPGHFHPEPEEEAPVSSRRRPEDAASNTGKTRRQTTAEDSDVSAEDSDDEPAPRARPRGAKQKKPRKDSARTVAAVALVVVFVGAVAAAIFLVPALMRRATKSGEPTFAESDWLPFAVPNRISCQMPGTPEVKEQIFGPSTVRLHVTQPGQDVIFGVGYTEGELLPERRRMSEQELLDDTCAGTLLALSQSGSAVEESRTPITLAGKFAGRKQVLRVSNPSGKLVYCFYHHQGRLYLVMVGGRAITAESAVANKFFASLEITEGTGR